MNDTGPGVGPGAWARHLSQPASGAPGPLSPAEARRVQRHLDRLQAALDARDRAALNSAKQAVLHAAFAQPCTPALRATLRLLAWTMAALRLPRSGRWQDHDLPPWSIPQHTAERPG